MLVFLVLIMLSGVMLGIGLKHDEIVLIVLATVFGQFIAFSYGRFVELRRATNFLRKVTGDNDES
jgi:hypothetical protein